MNPENKNNIKNFGQNDPEAIARVTTGISDVSDSLSRERQATPESGGRMRGILAGIGAVAAASFLLLPRVGGEAEPVQTDKTYTELSQDSAKVPLAPGDTVAVDSISIEKGNPAANTASEAILNNPAVTEYLIENPDQSTSLTASALTVPSASEYAVVERDIDGDGDGDAVAVAVDSSK